MPKEIDTSLTRNAFDQEKREWLNEAVNLVAAAEQQLSTLRGSKSQALEYIRHARSLLDTVVEWIDENVESETDSAR